MKHSKKRDKLQQTLLNYLGIEEPQQAIFSDISISLNWNGIDNYSVSYHLGKLDRPEDYIDSVTLCHGVNRNLHIYGRMSGDKNSNIIRFVEKPKFLYNKAVLKSNIQKAVRLGDVSRAIISSFSLIKIDLLSFLRRIVIIAIEDSALPSTLDFLIWLMVAYPNYGINNDIVRILLNTVYAITKYNSRLTLNYKPYIYGFSCDIASIQDSDLVSTPYICSLAIRKAYGGMHFDMVLLDIWIDGLYKKQEFNYIEVNTARPITIIKNIELDDIIMSSIDHHCMPDIIDTIFIGLDMTIPKDTIKSYIWDFSSSKNIRRDPKEYSRERIETWNRIKPIFYSIQLKSRNKLKSQIR